MNRISRLWLQYIDLENAFKNNPSELARLSLDNSKNRLDREVLKLKQDGLSDLEIETVLKESFRLAFPLADDTAKEQDFYVTKIDRESYE
jgi:hypothetical protein